MPRKSNSGWSARSIAASFERSIQSGRVTASEALPPVRELAARLKVSPATVAAAYRLLRTRGLTAAHGRRGTRIVPRPPIGTRAARTGGRL
ncbi:MAG: GntR family transcriptional regulator, partial [Vicinamibacterales bacterium]